MDTKWKRFKYSSGNKLLCVLLALLMVACLMSNVVQLAKAFSFYGEDVLKQETTSFYETYPFCNLLRTNLASIQYDLTSNERARAKQDYIDSFYAAYKKAEKENQLSSVNIRGVVSGYEYTDDGEYEAVYDDYSGDPYIIGVLEDGRKFYKGDDGYYYTKYMMYDNQRLNDANDDEDGVNFGRDENTVRDMAASYYNSNYGDGNYFNYRENYAALKNIRFYAVHEDGTVITNVDTDTKAFIQRVKNGEGNSIAYEPKGCYASGGLTHLTDYGHVYDNENFSIYVQIDSELKADDTVKAVYQSYLEVQDINLNFICINILVSFVLLIALAVASCRLAGHKDGALSMAKLDKMPFDLHFALMGTAVGFAGYGAGALVLAYAEYSAYGYSYLKNSDFDILFFKSGWFVAVVCIISMLIWLMILGFAMSLSRAVKCDYPVFSKLLVVRIVVLIFKVLKWFVFGIFRIIGKAFKGIGRALGSYAFKPKRLHKRSVPAVVLYTFFNLVSLGIIILLFSAYESFLNFCGFLGSVVLLGADGYLVYRAVKYMKSLDDIIAASEKGEPLPYNTDKLPQSLKILADSLEDTNAQLQQAVIKAVKDERTKTELITNVSHDLKTPLTSVINYIDLLQKCDIEDEDAKKYMAVIAEKSNKLKRLIEDLIEASKVSSGNVTLNKTMINLNELAAQAVVEETADIEKNNLQVIFEEAVDKHIVFADGTKIYRVFENLLSNARKYSAPGSRVYARVYSDADYGCFEIKNISKEQLNITAEELTERFVRGDQSRSQDGNGLGLSIAKELCRLNNGELIISIDGDLFKATVKLPKK
ncbi:MAG: hypothetical protein K2I14_01240 [Eubacterium sp.]|nr:hypothetical protein [Eubacterium sp.]